MKIDYSAFTTIDLRNVEWKTVKEVFGGDFHDQPGEGAAILHHDPETGEMVALVKVPPGFETPAPEIHPTVNQWDIIIEGEMYQGDEKLTPFTYRYYPKGVAHGPHRSEMGCLLVVGQDGPITIEYQYDDE